MNCLKKKAMFITAGFLGIGGYILYQNLKSRIDDLEDEIWGIEDLEVESTKNKDEIILENVKIQNSQNELHDEVQKHLQHAEEKSNEINKDDENKQ